MDYKAADRISRRTLVAAAVVSPFIGWTRLFAQAVTDGSCAKILPGRTPTPWFVSFDPLVHPPISGRPTIRPGQTLRGKWGFYTWACGADKVFAGTPDVPRPGWTLELDFEGHAVVSPVPSGNLLGVPDTATQSDFYRLGAPESRVLTMMVRNQSGQFVPKPNSIPTVSHNHPSNSDSGSTSILLVADNSSSIIFDDTTPADAKAIMWKTDTFTVGIVGHVSFTVPGAPFSAMTATGNINFTDLSSSPLLSQTTAYSIAIPVGGIGTIGAAATGPQNFQWPWFDHLPFGGITGLTSRTVRYDVTGSINDTFGNQYPVATGSRTYQITVSNTKISFVFASISAYTSAAVFGAASLVYSVLSGIAGALGQPELSALLGLGGGVTTSVGAYFAAVAVGDQAKAADPPVADPHFKEIAEFSQASMPKLPETKGTKDFQSFAAACSLITRIYPAITTTEGRVLGARAAKDLASLKKQQSHLEGLLQFVQEASRKMSASVQPAIKEIETLFATSKHPITRAQLEEELTHWSTQGIPAKLSEGFGQSGLSQEAVAVMGRRLKDRALRRNVLDIPGTLKSLSLNLTNAANGAMQEAKPFLELKV